MPEPQRISRQTLDDVPKRVLQFVIAVAAVPAIAAALASKGYNENEHAYAWERLTRLAVVKPGAIPPLVDKAVREAIRELDAWDEPNFAIIKAALERLHPAQAEFVFEDSLEPKQGSEAVVSVGTLLDRLDELESSPDRVATHDEDLAALKTLASRGYTAAERERLRGLIELTKSIVPVVPVSGEERERIVRELHAWLNDWSTTARKIITRRDYLIRLGLAKRRKSRGGGGGGGGAGSGEAGGGTGGGAGGGGTGTGETGTGGP